MSATKKKGRLRGSLFTRYLVFFFMVEIISLVVFSLVLSSFVTGTWEDEQKQKLYDYTQNISQVYQDYLYENDSEDDMSISRLCYTIESASAASRSDIFITDTVGKVVFCRHMAASEDSETGKITCDEHSAMKIRGEITTGILAEGIMATSGNLGGLYDEECFLAASVSRRNYVYDADAIVFAVQSLDTGLDPYRTNYTRIYIMAALGFLAITGFIVYVLSFNLIKPLRDMSEATKRYSTGDFSYRIKRNTINAVREFDDLAAAINSMAENLEHLENSRANFVANVSHELKTPMTTIGGFIDGILDGTIDGENRNYYLQIVSDEVKRLSRLVVSMLNMSKMEAGEMRINPEKFNLTQQIVSIFIAFEQKINDKNISIKGLDYLSNVYIEADTDMINQVFYNLIDNAVKFTEHGGEISVSMYIKGNDVTFSIKNTGKGIRNEDLDHVFERFYKGDKSRSLDAKSAGLGLFIVKSIVELHNGEISVSNVDNKYTQFTVKLKAKLIEV